MIRAEFDPIDYKWIRDLQPAVLQLTKREVHDILRAEGDTAELQAEIDVVLDQAAESVTKPGRVAYVILRIVHSEV